VNGEYQVIYDAAAPAFKVMPALVVLIIPVVLAGCFYVVESAVGKVSRRLKWSVWIGYAVYAFAVVAGYWETWQDSNDALVDARVIEGRLADGETFHKKTGRRTWTAFQKFTVNGVEFEERNTARSIGDALFPWASVPSLPLIDGARVRITYRDDGRGRDLLKFEIAADDFEAHD
jgi:hypothetical protein